MIVFWKWPDTETKEEHEEGSADDCRTAGKDSESYHGPVLRWYPVFHIQPNRRGCPSSDDAPVYDTPPVERAEKLMAEYVSREGIRLDISRSDQAYYSPVSDGLHLPALTQYSDDDDVAGTSGYYNVAFHSVSTVPDILKG